MQGPCTRCRHESRTRQDSWPREETELGPQSTSGLAMRAGCQWSERRSPDPEPQALTSSQMGVKALVGIIPPLPPARAQLPQTRSY